MLTGASSGIGEALALALAKRGAMVGLLARRAELLESLKTTIEKNDGQARSFVCDVTKRAEVFAMAESLREEFGRVDIMIANAGIGGNDRDTRKLMPDAVKRLLT